MGNSTTQNAPTKSSNPKDAATVKDGITTIVPSPAAETANRSSPQPVTAISKKKTIHPLHGMARSAKFSDSFNINLGYDDLINMQVTLPYMILMSN